MDQSKVTLQEFMYLLAIFLMILPAASLCSTIIFYQLPNLFGIAIELALIPLGWGLARYCSMEKLKVGYCASWGIMISFLGYLIRFLSGIAANIILGLSLLVTIWCFYILWINRNQEEGINLSETGVIIITDSTESLPKKTIKDIIIQEIALWIGLAWILWDKSIALLHKVKDRILKLPLEGYEYFRLSWLQINNKFF